VVLKSVSAVVARVPASSVGRVSGLSIGRMPVYFVGRMPVYSVGRRPGLSVGRVPVGPRPFGWPVTPPFVVRRFDPPPRPWLAGHRGGDLSAAPSAGVRAAGAGTVVYAGVIAGRGVVSVAHPGGLRTTY